MIDYTLNGKVPFPNDTREGERNVHFVDAYSVDGVTLSVRELSQRLNDQKQPIPEYSRSLDLAVSFDLDLWRVDATLMRTGSFCLEKDSESAHIVLEEKWAYIEPNRQLLVQIYDRLQDPTTIAAIKECYQTEHSPVRARRKRANGIVDLLPLLTSRGKSDFLPEVFVDYIQDSFAYIARVREQELRVQQYLQQHFGKANDALSNLPVDGRLRSLVADLGLQLNSFTPYSLPDSPYFKRLETPEEQVQRDEKVRQIVAGRCEEIIGALKKGDRKGKMRGDGGKMEEFIRPADTLERSFIKCLDQPIVVS